MDLVTRVTRGRSCCHTPKGNKGTELLSYSEYPRARDKSWRTALCRVLLVSLLLGFSPVRAGGEKPVTAGEILQRVDENRMISPEFAFEMEITAYESGEIIDQYTLAGYVRIREANTQTLLYFLAPSKVNGQKMLMS